MRITVVAFMMWAIAGMVLGPVAWAGDVDPDGVKLRGVVEEYIGSAPETDAKAQELKRAGGVNANGTSPGWGDVICGVEMMSLIGMAIWRDRLHADECGSQLPGLSEFRYCVEYTRACDHFQWMPDCLLKKGCLKN